MKKIIIVIALIIATAASGYSQKVKPVKPKELKTMMDSISYVFGMNIGKSMKQEKMELNIDIINRALAEAYKTEANLISEQQIQELMARFQTQMQEKQAAEAKAKGKVNREIADKFLAENKTKAGVITTPSGLQYKIINDAKGKKPQIYDRVRINYRLKLLNDSVVESTFERNSPVLMGIQNVIPGMKEALTLMQEGSICQFWIHPDLGYGDSDSKEMPAGSLLCFEVQLIEVVADSEQILTPNEEQPQ
ncbi:MAG: hypothetical protein H6Q15_178 [Bacteroidetes bacterium]|nr:hypothetical protein [Bacteroidota bacterium]